MKLFQTVVSDVRKRQNLDIYITIGLAIIVSVLGFAQIASQEVISSAVLATLALVSLSLLLNRRENEELQESLSATNMLGDRIEELAFSFGVSESNLFRSEKELEESIQSSVSNADEFVLDTSLNRMLPRIGHVPYFSGVEGGYRRVLFDRLRKGELRFKRVEIIYHREALELLIYRLLLHQGFDYLIKHYPSPDTPVPMLNFMSFDNKVCYFGGFYPRGAPIDPKSMRIRDRNLAKLLPEYWNNLWSNATSLNEGGMIDLTEVKKLCARLKISAEEFDDLYSQIRRDVNKVRKKHRLPEVPVYPSPNRLNSQC